MPEVELQGDIIIGGIPFMLAKQSQLDVIGAKRAWEVDYLEDSTRRLTGVDRNSSQTKDTVEFVYRWEAAHLGYGDGEDLRPGRYSEGYCDPSQPLRIVCPYKINTVTLTGATTNISAIIEVASLIWCAAGRYILSVDPASSNALATVKDFGANEVCQDMAIFEDYVYVALTTSNMFRYGPLSSSPSWSAVHDSLKFLWFHVGNEILWGVTPYASGAAGKLRKCAAGAAGGAWTVGNWTAGDPVGYTATDMNRPASLGPNIFVGKPEGLFSYNAAGVIEELIPDLHGYRNTLNFHNLTPWHGMLYLPHEEGLYAYNQSSGEIAAVGPEVHPVNTSAIVGYVRAAAGDGTFLYIAIEDTSGNTYVLKGRPHPLSGREKFIWFPLTKVTSNVCRAMYYSNLSEARLWFGNDTNVSYYRMGGTLTYENGEITFAYYDDGFPFDDKVLLAGLVEGTFASGTSVGLYYTLDEGTERQVGSNFTSETSQDISANNVGKRIKVRAALNAKSDNTATPQIRALTLTGVRRPSTRVIITAQILCTDDQILRDGSLNSLTASAQLSELRTWATGTSTVTVVDPTGTSRTMFLLPDVKETEVGILGNRYPEILATVRLRA